MKKRIIQKIVVFSLVLAMQAAPLSYAADEGTGGQPGENVTITEDDGTEGNDTVAVGFPLHERPEPLPGHKREVSLKVSEPVRIPQGSKAEQSDLREIP